MASCQNGHQSDRFSISCMPQYHYYLKDYLENFKNLNKGVRCNVIHYGNNKLNNKNVNVL